MSHPGVEIISGFLADSGLATGTISEQREAMGRTVSSSPAPEGVRVEGVSLGGRPAEWITSDGVDADAVVLYLHGGGYCTGSLDSHRMLGARIAVASGCTVAVLDYRLAPEHRFPDAVTDATSAYADLVALGVRADRIAIGGDSAGGGLAMAAVLALRDAGASLPGAVVCLSPWVDLTQSAPSYDTLADRDPMVTKDGLDLMAQAYLGDVDPRTELASPLFAADLIGLPPVMIEVGACEVLLDDATRLADRLREAGGRVAFTVWPELIHVFQAFPGELIPEADQSIAAVGSFVGDRLGAPTVSDTRSH
ncbi:MAG TPA: alpha/beta hydrolase [Acidimicrobiales bacterium]|nr:alpha/beta hydrolase [Acidimicrobiales bacterium]